MPSSCSKDLNRDDKRFIDYPEDSCYVSCPELTLEMNFDRRTEILDLADTTDHPILVRKIFKNFHEKTEILAGQKNPANDLHAQ